MRRLIIAAALALLTLTASADGLFDIVTKGSTDRSVTVDIIDSTDGTPETGVAFNTSGIDLWYRREGAALTSITEASLASLTTAHTDGGFIAIANGKYRLDLPDAAFATGANYVDFGGTVTGMIVIGGRVRLVDYPLESAVLPADAISLSGDSGAADRLEALLDGTCLAFPELGILRGVGCTATAYNAGTPSVTLDASAAFGDNTLRGALIMVCATTPGYCQSEVIVSNVGSSDIVTLRNPLPVSVSGTITFTIYGTTSASPVDVEKINGHDICGSGTEADPFDGCP